MANIPFARGRNAKIAFVLDSKKLELFPKTWSVKQNATEYADDVGGEDRARVGKIINWYDWSMNIFLPDMAVLLAFLGYDAKVDTLTQPFEFGAGILIYPNNGTKVAFEGRDGSIDGWTLNGLAGRTEASSMDMPFRTRYFESVPSI